MMLAGLCVGDQPAGAWQCNPVTTPKKKEKEGRYPDFSLGVPFAGLKNC